MRHLIGFLILSIGLTACLPTAQLEQGPGIIGTYVVNGLDPIGTEYTGRLNISRGSDANDVIFEWIITGAIIRGEGTQRGNIVELTWETITSPQGTSTGTAEYEVLDDGYLIGTLHVDGTDEVGTETVYPDP
ncbi:MAG: hypothetical protein U9N56_08780 [Actinomycetota bacterium]|nr:hypothetical protein [Actinomycetota bacterium]